ncbi:flagellar export chaperone FliS [Luminiphilus sp.]|nr:flagellar export chaperone FliS [Luminiphilus sp.]
MNTQALTAYQQTSVHTQVEGASPHKLITMLLDGALERTQKAKLAMKSGDIATKGELIGRAIDIVGSLDAYLDLEQGGEIAENLRALYEYIVLKLFEANTSNDSDLLDEVVTLLTEVRAGWKGIEGGAED